MILIGLTGPEGAGKSKAARLLSVNLGVPIVPFAAPLKGMLEALGVPKANLYGEPEQKAAPLDMLGGRSARHAMQTLGTEWGRQLIAPDLWQRAWLAKANGNAIADDVRFQNEAETILAAGGIVLQVIRSLADLDRVPLHLSEDFAALPFTVRIVNDRCPTVLRDRLMAEVNAWMGRQILPQGQGRAVA